MDARISAVRENESGFTLIELLVVIVILGALAGIVVFSVSGITDRGDAAACKANVKTVQIAQAVYFAKETPSAYAASVTALVTAGLLASPAPTDVATTTTGEVTHTCSFTTPATPSPTTTATPSPTTTATPSTTTTTVAPSPTTVPTRTGPRPSLTQIPDPVDSVDILAQ